MIKEFENSKGFLILEVSRERMVERLEKYGCLGICDTCLCIPEVGYYVAVLNIWFCKECFDDWYSYAVRYQEDIPIERKNYECYKALLQ